MDVKVNNNSFNTSPPLAIIACALLTYCDEFNLPLDITKANEEGMTINTHGWTEQLVYKFQYQVKRDYYDMKRVSCDLCIVREYSIEINVNKDFKPTRFTKD